MTIRSILHFILIAVICFGVYFLIAPISVMSPTPDGSTPSFYAEKAPAPSIALSAKPPLFKRGQSNTVSWFVNDAESCISGANNDVPSTWTTPGLRGSFSFVPKGNTTLTLICTGPGGVTIQKLDIADGSHFKTAPRPSTIFAAATPQTTYTPSWIPTSYTSPTPPPTNQAPTYTYIPPPNTNSGAPTTNPLPILHFSATPLSVVPGQSVTVTWSTAYTTSCTSSGYFPSAPVAWTQPGLSGTISFTPTTAVNLILACSGPGGTAISSADISIIVPDDTDPPNDPPDDETPINTDPPGITAPHNVQGAISGNVFNISWDNGTTLRTELGNEISIEQSEYSLASFGWSPWTAVSADGCDLDGCTIFMGIEKDLIYKYRVRTYNALTQLYSEYSNETGPLSIPATPPITVLPWSAPSSVLQGDDLTYTLNWSGQPIIPDNGVEWEIFVHFVRRGGGNFGGDFYPTPYISRWPGGPISTNRILMLSPSVPLGTYDVYVGIYRGSVRKELIAGPGVVTESVISRRYLVGTIEITP